MPDQFVGPADEVTLVWWGEIDIDNAPRMRADLITALNSGAAAIYVDLTGVTFMDSAGIGVLVGGWRQARGQGVELIASTPSAQVRRSLEMVGLFDVLTEPGGDAG